MTGVVMIRRALLAVIAILAVSYVLNHAARATEAAVPRAVEGSFAMAEADRARVLSALRRENMALVGDVRRKGQLMIATGVQHGAPWRLVIDAASGEIIGRRPLAEPAALPR